MSMSESDLGINKVHNCIKHQRVIGYSLLWLKLAEYAHVLEILKHFTNLVLVDFLPSYYDISCVIFPCDQLHPLT